MRITRTAIVVACSSFAVAATATALRAQDKSKATDRSITISGCVVAGEAADTFILKDVKQLSNGWMAPEPKDPAGVPAFYWLNTADGLAERVGKRVEVAGVVDFSDAHKGQTKIEVDPTETKDTKT
jgi:hypothetical protein